MSKRTRVNLGYATFMALGIILIASLTLNMLDGFSPVITMFMIAVLVLALYLLRQSDKEERKAEKTASDLDDVIANRKPSSTSTKKRSTNNQSQGTQGGEGNP